MESTTKTIKSSPHMYHYSTVKEAVIVIGFAFNTNYSIIESAA
jgi:hypothetical protein